MSLSWDDLRVALAVARSGTLARAGATLGLDATTVGRRLATIHERIGQPLFERHGTALAATRAGREVIAELEAMEAAALAAERKLAATPAAAGPVRIAATDSFTLAILLEMMRPLADELPGIELEIVAAQPVADLRRREADVSLRFARPHAGDLRGRRVGGLRWSLYASPGYLAHRPRVDPERQLAGHRVIRWPGRPVVTAWLDDHARAATVALETPQLHVAVAACARGWGLAVMPGSIGKAHGLVRVIDHAIDAVELWLVVHRDLRRVPRVRAVADWLAARLGAATEALRAI